MKVIFLSDIHAGNQVSVKSDRAVISQDDTISPQNKQQEILFNYWKELAKTWKNPDILIVNGDTIDGLNGRNAITYCWSDNLIDQANDAIRLVNMFGAKKTFVVRGTPYHTSTKGVDIEEYFAEKLDAVRTGERYTDYSYLVNCAPPNAPKRIIHITHHVGGSKWFMYRGTALSRDMAGAILNESHFVDKSTGEKIRGIVRGHNHYFWYTESASRFMLQLPCWQLMTPFAHKVAAVSPPDIGAVRMEFFNDGFWDEEHRLLKPRELLPKVY